MMKMTENFKILANLLKICLVKHLTFKSYLFVKENISKYHLNIDITSKALKK